MMRPTDLRTAALSLPEAAEAPHFEATSFCVRKKIFATFGEAEDRAILKLTPEQQEGLCAAAPSLYAPVKGWWGKKGWTMFDLAAADTGALRHALVLAYRNVAPKTLARLVEGEAPSTKPNR